MDRILHVKLLKWGNSYGLRVSKRDVERAGWHVGKTVAVHAVDEDERLAVPHFTFHGGPGNMAEDHDEVLYGWGSDA